MSYYLGLALVGILAVILGLALVVILEKISILAMKLFERVVILSSFFYFTIQVKGNKRLAIKILDLIHMHSDRTDWMPYYSSVHSYNVDMELISNLSIDYHVYAELGHKFWHIHQLRYRALCTVVRSADSYYSRMSPESACVYLSSSNPIIKKHVARILGG